MSIARALGLMILTTLGLGGAASAGRYEEPDYQLVDQLGELEIREYAPRLHAEVRMTGERDRSAGDAFKILAGYIFSSDTPTGEAIGMTVPVGQYTDAADGAWSMWFVMPSRYTLDTLPPVTDSRIQLIEQPAQRIAALAFSGRMNTADFSVHAQALLEALSTASLVPIGEPVLAVYNGPLTPGPFRRNEVLIAIQ